MEGLCGLPASCCSCCCRQSKQQQQCSRCCTAASETRLLMLHFCASCWQRILLPHGPSQGLGSSLRWPTCVETPTSCQVSSRALPPPPFKLLRTSSSMRSFLFWVWRIPNPPWQAVCVHMLYLYCAALCFAVLHCAVLCAVAWRKVTLGGCEHLMVPLLITGCKVSTLTASLLLWESMLSVQHTWLGQSAQLTVSSLQSVTDKLQVFLRSACKPCLVCVTLVAPRPSPFRTRGKGELGGLLNCNVDRGQLQLRLPSTAGVARAPWQHTPLCAAA